MVARLSQVFRGRTAQNLLALYGVQFANYLLPLITLPYLTRVLGPESWGSLVVVQSFAQYLSLLVEYGFNLQLRARWLDAVPISKVCLVFWWLFLEPS